MASDGNAEHPVHMGDNITMSIIRDDEATLTGYFDKLAVGGKVKPQVDKVFGLDEIKEAFTHLETGHPQGKVVLKVRA